MGTISERGWYVLAAVPFASVAVSFALLFVDPLVAGVVMAVGMLVVTPVLAVVLWTRDGRDDGDEEGPNSDTSVRR